LAIIIKKDSTMEPFNLKLLRDTKWSLMAQSRHRSEEADEYDGEVDFGAEFQSHDIELHCVTDDGLTVEQKYQKKVEISDALNKFRNGDWLIFESNPGKKIFAHFAGRVQIEEYPTWLRVNIPLRLDPFWVSIEENEAIRDSGVLTKLENIPGGNYVQYNGVTYLKLSGTTRRVMDLELSETSRWRNDPDWPTQAELSGGNWTIYKRKVETDGPFGRAYWTSTEIFPDSDYAYLVDPFGVVDSMFKTILFFTRLCHILPEDLYAITGTGEEESPYILDVIPIVNKGTYETPVVIEVSAESGDVASPAVSIGDEVVKYNGIIPQGKMITINTDKMTVILDGENALANHEGGFPKLPPGETNVSVTAESGNPTVTLRWYDRWA
jgi:phage-related protein